FAGVSGWHVRLSIFVADVGRSAVCDQSLSAPIDDVSDSFDEVVGCCWTVEGKSHVTAVRHPSFAAHAPGDPAGLVVHRYVQVPGSTCLVLRAPFKWRRRVFVPCAALDDLQRNAEW